MSSFIQPDFPQQHQGVLRLESAVASVQQAGKRVEGAKGVVALLIAAVASALVVAADQLVSTWAEGELLLAWVALWALVFAVVVLFADGVRQWRVQLTGAIERQMTASRNRAQDAQLWAAASSDPRLMAELDAAILRAEATQTPTVDQPASAQASDKRLDDSRRPAVRYKYWTQYY
jgi:hypothetical protein